jgi:peptidoglycan/LPS O-acetylase OafA/YrhL
MGAGGEFHRLGDQNKVPLGTTGLLAGLLVVITALAIAYLSLRFYDKPVREWLRKSVLMKRIIS